MKAAAGLLVALLAANGRAAPAYVTDEIVLGVYPDQKTQGQRLATLHSGAAVETLAVDGESTQVRLAGGTIGWVKSAYLTNGKPATVRVKELQDELDRTRATTPALAEAAERSEVQRLTRELSLRQAADSQPTAGNGSGPVAVLPAASAGHAAAIAVGWWIAAVVASLAAGFWLGHAALARRIRQKFGGIKVY